jgi:uncharacterized protein YjhX (UPF0386 family)
VRTSDALKGITLSPSNLEKQLKHERRTNRGILVPLLEDFMRMPVNIESQEDVDWMHDLLEIMVDREERRNAKAKVFSPSALASCLRQVYLLKHHLELGIEKLAEVRIEPNYYFLTGNFLHLKWQFALYKMEKRINDPDIFQLLGVEVAITSKRNDHGGTVDAIALVHGVPYIIDFKGLNVRSFGEITRAFVPHQYEVQLSDYMLLWNSMRKRPYPFNIKKALLIAENKGGPDAKHPIALHEHVIGFKEHLPEVQLRLEVLRDHEKENEIPAPECITTKGFQFAGCPFQKFCKKEVKEIEASRRASSSDSQLKVARPSRKAKATRAGRRMG